MADETKPKRQMPKGGRKGGTRYPRHKLDIALTWSKKLVSKTHVEKQPIDVIFAGVVGAKSGEGAIRISTLKQYGLLLGDPKGYHASALAKRIEAALPEEVSALKQQAFALPAVFKNILTTYQGDEVSIARLKQRALELDVHPEEADGCIDCFVAGLTSAGLGTLEGDRVALRQSLAPSGEATIDPVIAAEVADGTEVDDNAGAEEQELAPDVPLPNQTRAKAVFNVSVSLDASLDTEKLEKQLAILKRYGAI